MWIRELFIDEFDDGGDLVLTQLAPAVNVVRVPSLSAEACLAQFIPTLLYGPLHPHTPLRGGSLVVAQRGAGGVDDVLDLCRLRLDGAAGLSELEVLTEADRVANQQRLLDTLEAIDGPVFQVVFTDHLPPTQRLAQWRTADWIVPLLRRAEACPSAENPPVPGAQWTITSDQVQRTAVLGRAVKVCEQLAAGFAPRVDSCVDADSRTVPAGPDRAGGGEPIAGRSTATAAIGDRGDRESYLHASGQLQVLETDIARLRQQIGRLENIGRLFEGAESWQAEWNDLQALERHLAGPVDPPISARDLKRLRQVRRRMRAIRQRLAQAETSQTTSCNGQDDADAIDGRLARLGNIAHAWSACRARHERIEQLKSQVDQLAIVQRAERQCSETETRAAIREIRHAAKRLRSARLAAGRPRASLTGAMELIDERNALAEPRRWADTDPRIENLRRQIRQLREETRTLLQRQMVSPGVQLGLGLLFSAGAAILGAAMLVNLDGAELAIGAIGLICMFSAALLKSSFERTPNHRLREQRIRIAALLDELQRMRPTADESSQAAALEAHDDAERAAAVAAPADVDSDTHVDAAERNWRSTAARWRIPEDLDPLAAVRYVRAHNVKSGDSAFDGDMRQCLEKLERDQAEVIRWCQRAAAALEQDWNAELSPHEWWDQLQAEQRRLAAHRRELADSPAAACDTIALRDELGRLSRRRREILSRTGPARLAELRGRLRAQQERAQCAADRQRRLERFEASLPGGADGQLVRHWLQDNRELHRAQERHPIELLQAQRQLAAAEAQRAKCQADVQRLAAKTAHKSSVSDRTNTDSASAEPTHHARRVVQLIRAVLSSLGGEPSSGGLPALMPPGSIAANQSRLLQMASEALQRLSGDSTLTVGWIDRAQGPYIVNGEAGATSCDDLTPAQEDLLVTALQLSLVRCLNERVGHLPLVLTDQSMGLPVAILERLATLLNELAETGQQVLVITVDPTVSQQFRQLGVPSLVVTRQESILTRPALDRSAVAGERLEG